MAGIYIHVPFCASRCAYCDFYSTTRGEKCGAYVDALANELRLRAGFLSRGGRMPVIETIYVGGGTPTTLDASLLGRVFDVLYATYDVDESAEVTVEANPDDLAPRKIESLRALPVNRLSIGVQTFDDGKLRLLRRRHGAKQAVRAVCDSQAAGFHNISIDLMYGLPAQSLREWETDVDMALSLRVQHVSAYALTCEKGTPLWDMRERHAIEEAEEETVLDMYDLLKRRLEDGGFEHYEISNFARPGFRSRHNSGYWKGTPYLGCGPSAHSFDGRDRQWNSPDLDLYIDGAGRCLSPEDFGHAPWIEREELTPQERYNDCVITALRTSDGLDLDEVERKFGRPMADYCLQAAAPHLREGLLEVAGKGEQPPGGLLRLTRRGIMLSDSVMRDLLYVAD